MKTVRLPIYDGDIETGEQLEVDLSYFIPPTIGMRSSQARIIEAPTEEVNHNLWGFLRNKKLDNVELVDVASEYPDAFEKAIEQSRIAKQEILGNFAPPEEWRTIEGLPTKSFQINQRGQIRHIYNQKIIEPSLDLNSKYYMTVKLMINGLAYFINGPKLAEEMWA